MVGVIIDIGGGLGGPGGGFGGPGGGFFSLSSSSGLPLLLLSLKPPPGPTKPPPGQFRSCGKSYPSYFWGRTLTEGRVYSNFTI